MDHPGKLWVNLVLPSPTHEVAILSGDLHEILAERGRAESKGYPRITGGGLWDR